MNDDIERHLRESAALAARLSAQTPIPDPPRASGRSHHRALVAAAAFVGAVGVVGVVGLVASRSADDRSISPANESSPATSTTIGTDTIIVSASETTAVTNASIPATVTTVAPTSLPPVTDVASAEPADSPSFTGTPVFGLSLTDGAELELPAALGVIPDGYRVALANGGDGATSAGGSPEVYWYSTYIHAPVIDGELVEYVQVQFSKPYSEDPYSGFPSPDPAQDVQIGDFVGRWVDYSGIDGYSNFLIPLDAERNLLVSGRTTHDVVETVVAGLQLRPDDPQAADATVLPDGFVFLDEGLGFEPTASEEYDLLYVRGQASNSTIDIRTYIDPSRPALVDTIGPMEPRIIDIDGRQAVIALGRLTMDITPDYQIQVTVGGPGGFPSDDPDVDELVEIVRNLVAIDGDQFNELRESATPYAPTDGECSQYIVARVVAPATVDPTSDAVVPVATPGTISVELSSRQPLAQITIALDTGDEDVVLAAVPLLSDQPVTVALAWDGTIDGQPATAGTYSEFTVDARPMDPTKPDVCSATGSDPNFFGGGMSLGAAFVVE